MAQKRMFDRAIIDTDRFMDLSMSAKALYFLLGMEADDEGFVSYKKVMRIHGGNEDDIKILIAKQFIINFPSGVVVITDWNTNNWLDTRRIRPTEYQREKSLLSLSKDKKYLLSNRLAIAKTVESSIEESSIVEKSIERESTPSEIAKDFFSRGKYFYEYAELFKKNAKAETVDSEFDKFILYWTEPNKSGTKVRWQQQDTFEVKRRLLTWLGRIGQYSGKKETKII